MWHFLPVRGRRGAPPPETSPCPSPSHRPGEELIGLIRRIGRIGRMSLSRSRSCAPPFHGDMVKNHNDPLSPEEATHGSAVREARAVEVGLRPFPARSAADDGRRAAGPGGDLLARRPARVPVWFQRHLQALHTGQASPASGLCAGRALNDRVARGYVTMDAVSRCALLTPRDPGYFGPGGVATSQNVLWGDFFYVDQGQGFADGENLVRLKADP